MMPDNLAIGSPTRTRAIMEAYGLSFKKSLGQNFLCDQNVLRKICETAAVTDADDVIEIGPGIGALTEQLAQRAHKVLALEIDQRLIPVLGEVLADYPNVSVVNQDVLKADLKALVAEHFDGKHKLKVVANLPYYITTPIVLHLLECGVDLSDIVIMMQKEVAERICGTPGTKAYGSLSCAVQAKMTATTAFIVPKSVFVPQPKIDSAIVHLHKPAEPPVTPRDFAAFSRLIKIAFTHRRKSLWNNLTAGYGKDAATKEALAAALEAADISPQIRAEKLSLSDFTRLADELVAQQLTPKQ